MSQNCPEEIDLLTPEIVDRDTGYRYYSVGQLQKIFSITKLKSMGYCIEPGKGIMKRFTLAE